MTLVLDVSEFAGVPAYKLLRDRGAEGVIIRGTSGPWHVDRLVEEQIAAARAAGLVVLALYHYCYSWHPGEAQAAHAVAVAAKLGLPTCPDFERVASGPPRPTDEPARARVTALAFLRQHRALTGRRAVTYGPVHYLRDMRLEGDDVGPLWAADTRASRAKIGPEIVPPWKEAILWQYAHNEEVAGLHGGLARVDWNRSELTIEQLAAVFRGEEAAPSSGRSLGAVVAGVRAAEGRGPGGVEDFVSRPEGPVID